mmetsp:Transcript_71777/g.191535  ORF Transcript_71777/g.191535 Transcript_71777/m.191535 type:complete len:317 (-) Transcript_71777:3663-4613(-)
MPLTRAEFNGIEEGKRACILRQCTTVTCICEPQGRRIQEARVAVDAPEAVVDAELPHLQHHPKDEVSRLPNRLLQQHCVDELGYEAPGRQPHHEAERENRQQSSDIDVGAEIPRQVPLRLLIQAGREGVGVVRPVLGQRVPLVLQSGAHPCCPEREPGRVVLQGTAVAAPAPPASRVDVRIRVVVLAVRQLVAVRSPPRRCGCAGFGIGLQPGLWLARRKPQCHFSCTLSPAPLLAVPTTLTGFVSNTLHRALPSPALPRDGLHLLVAIGFVALTRPVVQHRIPPGHPGARHVAPEARLEAHHSGGGHLVKVRRRL